MALCCAAACHTGGQNVVQAEKTLQKDALVSYLDGGFKVESIVNQASSLSPLPLLAFKPAAHTKPLL